MQHRKLAAIMFTDIVGYTTLMGESEQKAFNTIKTNREIHERLTEKHHGKIIKELGDGLLTIFVNGTEAVLCAVDIQKEAHEKNIPLRIGIHEGEVVFENDDVLGDGVNIASRIQTEAASGGVCISDSIYRIIRNKEDLYTQSMGKKSLKNVKEPVALYQLNTPGLQTRSINDSWKLKWWITPMIGIVCLGIGYLIHYTSNPIEPIKEVQRFSINLPVEAPIALIGSAHFNAGQRAITISPDGKTLVYVSELNGSNMLYKRALDSFEAFPLSGTNGAFHPFFSPDGQWIGFFTRRHLKKVNIDGGEPLVLCAVTHPYGGTWSIGDKIYFSNSEGRTLNYVSVSGGTSREIVLPESDPNRTRWPFILPDGEHILLNDNQNKGYILTITSGDVEQLPLTGSNLQYISSGHIVYAARGRLLSIPFNLKSLKIAGIPFPIVDNLRTESLRNSAQYDISKNGVIFYVSGMSIDKGELVYVNREGKIIDKVAIRPDYYGEFFISPDNQKIIYSVSEGSSENEQHHRIYDKSKNSSTNIVNEFKIQRSIWAPDNRLFFTSSQDNHILWKEYENTEINLFYKGDSEPFTRLLDISNNGEFMIVGNSAGNNQNLWSISLKDTTELRQVANSAGWLMTISSDNNYIAYTSSESGQYEVYVIPYLQTGQKWQISNDGGMEPIWSPDGKEIYFRSLDMKKMMMVTIITDPEFLHEKPRILWEGDFLDIPGYSYDITPDGQYFLMKKSVVKEHTTTQINVITNFFEEVKQKAVVQ